MRYMNDYDIQRAADMYWEHPILGPAVETLVNLVRWTNRNSDGWAYWNKPCAAASKLMEMIERDGTARYSFDSERADVTEAEYKKALVPIKSFRTKHRSADFEIVEIGDRERKEAAALAEATAEFAGLDRAFATPAREASASPALSTVYPDDAVRGSHDVAVVALNLGSVGAALHPADARKLAGEILSAAERADVLNTLVTKEA